MLLEYFHILHSPSTGLKKLCTTIYGLHSLSTHHIFSEKKCSGMTGKLATFARYQLPPEFQGKCSGSEYENAVGGLLPYPSCALNEIMIAMHYNRYHPFTLKIISAYGERGLRFG